MQILLSEKYYLKKRVETVYFPEIKFSTVCLLYQLDNHRIIAASRKVEQVTALKTVKIQLFVCTPTSSIKVSSIAQHL